MKKLAKLAIFSFLIAVVVVPTNIANAEVNVAAITQEHVQDEVIVGYFDNGSSAENASVRGNSYKAVNAIAKERISPRNTNTEVVKIGNGISVEAAIGRLKNQPGIKFVEPNYIVHSMATSNDPYFTNSSLWGMYGSSTSPANQFGSNSAIAWASGYVGSSEVVVGIIDEGVQILHPDLTANRWINPGEIAGDGIDNDNNGYIDDVNGWDFVNNNASVYDGGTTGSLDSHGTHVSGTIGGSGGNSIGVAGVNWNVKIISTKFLGANGGTTDNAVKALDYLTNLKTRTTNPVNLVATNNSWGGGGISEALLNAINASGDAGMLFIAAAGNSTNNNDATVSYPSNYVCTTSSRSTDCMIAVAAIDSSGAIAGFSSYGATTVDLGAPGVGIYSTLPNNTYGSYSGTSMATPHVTGAVALCKSIFPSITPDQIRNAVLSSATATTSLSGKTATGGRLNVGAMAANCANLNSSLQNQGSLNILTSPTTVEAGTPISLSSSGGSGSGQISYVVSGQNCVISSSTVNATASTTCSVSAIREASGNFRAATSSPVSFNFTTPPPPPLVISNTILTASKGNSGITLTSSGGSGTGAVTFSATPSSCVVSKSNKLTVSKSVPGTVLCSVTATKAASGIYASQTSGVKVFTFR
jgi:subtilisin family serine protease